MAKQTGLVKYSGTMGGVRHFKIKGLQGDFAGMIGGPSGQQINSAPEFERTRENMNLADVLLPVNHYELDLTKY